MLVLVVNAGSSSLKIRLLDGHDQVVRRADLDAGTSGFDKAALGSLLARWERPHAVGHRVVHGGTVFTGAVRVDSDVRDQLEALTDLAPLHQPKSLLALDAVTHLMPDVPAVACFDTAFHTTIPDAAATYAVPLEWRTRYGVRRYGFHGLSHAYCSRRAAELVVAGFGGLRVVTCHLGAGASLAAVIHGRSVDTTMGFTPLEGLVMATRSGSVDPGLVLWLEEHEHLAPHEVARALEERSGLLALAGTGDMREIELAVERGEPAATLALEVYVHRLSGAIAQMCASMGGLDALVFTGGVGEHSPVVRRLATARLDFLGVRVDAQRNEAARGDCDVTADGSVVRTLVVEAREDIEISRETRRLMEQG